MENKKVRMVVEFEINSKTLEEKGKTAEEVVDAIEMHDHDTIDGFEIYPRIDDVDACSDFFLNDAKIVSKNILEESNAYVLFAKLNEHCGGFCVADDILTTRLYDEIEEQNFDISGVGEGILRTWEKSTDKKAVEEMFYIFTTN